MQPYKWPLSATDYGSEACLSADRVQVYLKRPGCRLRTLFFYLIGPVAQLDSASDYESEGYKFESCQDHLKFKGLQKCSPFLFCYCYTFVTQNRNKGSFCRDYNIVFLELKLIRNITVLVQSLTIFKGNLT